MWHSIIFFNGLVALMYYLQSLPKFQRYVQYKQQKFLQIDMGNNLCNNTVSVFLYIRWNICVQVQEQPPILITFSAWALSEVLTPTDTVFLTKLAMNGIGWIQKVITITAVVNSGLRHVLIFPSIFLQKPLPPPRANNDWVTWAVVGVSRAFQMVVMDVIWGCIMFNHDAAC